jgi:hypothetical protein
MGHSGRYGPCGSSRPDQVGRTTSSSSPPSERRLATDCRRDSRAAPSARQHPKAVRCESPGLGDDHARQRLHCARRSRTDASRAGERTWSRSSRTSFATQRSKASRQSRSRSKLWLTASPFASSTAVRVLPPNPMRSSSCSKGSAQRKRRQAVGVSGCSCAASSRR